MLQIFVPNVRGASTEQLARLGLVDLLDENVSCMAIDVNRGPDGAPGVVFSWGDFENVRTGYHSDEQHWEPCKAHPSSGRAAAAFWLGRLKERTIKPTDLARPRQFPGVPVSLADGNQWLVPIAAKLPRKITLDAAGEPVLKIAPRYEQFYERAARHIDLLRGWKRGERIEIPAGYSFAVEAVSLNYRFNRDVADFLDLFTEENLVWTIGATFEVREADAFHRSALKNPGF